MQRHWIPAFAGMTVKKPIDQAFLRACSKSSWRSNETSSQRKLGSSACGFSGKVAGFLLSQE
jgi:hypothetical protein